MAILSVVLLGMMQLYGHIRGQMIRTEAALIAQQRAELTAGYALAAARKASLRYTNFSAGTHTSLASCYNSNSNICEPNEYGSSDEDYLQITGSAKGHGLWNDKRTDQGCIDNPFYGVCGYYVEWGGCAGETPLNLVEIKRIDLAKYRNFCNTGS